MKACEAKKNYILKYLPRNFTDLKYERKNGIL
jgi:hypothetical protein